MNWQKTKTRNLLRHKSSGNYYGRWKIAGKQKWKSLGTEVYERVPKTGPGGVLVFGLD